jgi:hypothetical protein
MERTEKYFIQEIQGAMAVVNNRVGSSRERPPSRSTNNLAEYCGVNERLTSEIALAAVPPDCFQLVVLG